MIDPISASPVRGIQTAVARFERHSEVISRGDVNADDMVGLIESERSVEANVVVARTADQMVGTLLDMFA
jgi:flagellar basal body rod protein FlgG